MKFPLSHACPTHTTHTRQHHKPNAYYHFDSESLEIITLGTFLVHHTHLISAMGDICLSDHELSVDYDNVLIHSAATIWLLHRCLSPASQVPVHTRILRR